jgi:hypothetical protein
MIPVLDHLDQVSIFGRSSVAFFLILGLDWAFSAVHAYDEWRGEEAPLWRVFGRHLRMLADVAALAAGNGRRAGGDHRGADIRHAGVALGALCSGLPSKSGPQVDAALRARSGFPCAYILEGPLVCSMCGMGRHSAGRGVFHPSVAGAAGVADDPALLGPRALDSMAAAAGMDERVTSRLPGSMRLDAESATMARPHPSRRVHAHSRWRHASRLHAPSDEDEHARLRRIGLLGGGRRFVGLVYWALADTRREAPWFGPKTTTVAPVFTRL